MQAQVLQRPIEHDGSDVKSNMVSPASSSMHTNRLLHHRHEVLEERAACASVLRHLRGVVVIAQGGGDDGGDEGVAHSGDNGD